MSKRANEFDILEEPSKKFQRFSTPGTEDQAFGHLSALPTELIYSIISFLDDEDDIKNCFLVSKQFRKFLFCDPEIMRKFVFKLDFQSNLIEFSCVKKFLKNSGFCIRCLKVEVNKKQTEYIWKMIEFLHRMPNLEELSFEDPAERRYFDYYRLYEDKEALYERAALLRTLQKYPVIDEPEPYYELYEPADLSKLKTLKIRFQDMRILIRKVINLKSVEKLSISIKEFRNQSILIDMLNECENLKDLTIFENEHDEKIFSELEVSNILGVPMDDKKMMIKLKKFNSDVDDSDFEMAKFIGNQVDNLEELVLTCDPKEHFQDIWPKFKKLTKLALLEELSSTNHKMDKIKCFKTQVDQNLREAYERFPNLEIYKTQSILNTEGMFAKLHTLEISYLNIRNLKYAKFPNLKNFIVTDSIELEDFTNSGWILLCENIPNVEFMKISILDESACDICVLDCLPVLKKLKKFQYRHEIFGRRVEPFETNELVPEDLVYYKISVDTVQKIVKVCHFIIDNDFKIMTKLYKNFSNFEFIEFCFQDPQKIYKKNTFDPLTAIQTRTKPERIAPHNTESRYMHPMCQICYPDGSPSDFTDDEDECDKHCNEFSDESDDSDPYEQYDY